MSRRRSRDRSSQHMRGTRSRGRASMRHGIRASGRMHKKRKSRTSITANARRLRRETRRLPCSTTTRTRDFNDTASGSAENRRDLELRSRHRMTIARSNTRSRSATRRSDERDNGHREEYPSTHRSPVREGRRSGQRNAASSSDAVREGRRSRQMNAASSSEAVREGRRSRQMNAASSSEAVREGRQSRQMNAASSSEAVREGRRSRQMNAASSSEAVREGRRSRQRNAASSSEAVREGRRSHQRNAASSSDAAPSSRSRASTRRLVSHNPRHVQGRNNHQGIVLRSCLRRPTDRRLSTNAQYLLQLQQNRSFIGRLKYNFHRIMNPGEGNRNNNGFASYIRSFLGGTRRRRVRFREPPQIIYLYDEPEEVGQLTGNEDSDEWSSTSEEDDDEEEEDECVWGTKTTVILAIAVSLRLMFDNWNDPNMYSPTMAFLRWIYNKITSFPGL